MSQPTPTTRRAALAAGLGSVALLATGCSERRSFWTAPAQGGAVFYGMAMGSTYTVKIATPRLSDTGLAAAQGAVGRELADVVARMSHYDAESEVSRLNRHPVGQPFALTPPTQQVFAVAQSVRTASGGAFDVAVGRAVDEWGFGPSDRLRHVLPAPLLEPLRLRAQDSDLQLDLQAGTVTRRTPVLANLSGIAKGFGVDQAALALERLGIADFMIEVGGEVRARGRNAHGRPWQLAIERPDAMPQQAIYILPLDGLSLATSGDYRNFFVEQGRRYSHEIDPARAEPVDHALASVSVVAADCTQADAWSTALFVLGPTRGLALAQRLGLAAYFIVRQDDGRFAHQATPAFAALGGHLA